MASLHRLVSALASLAALFLLAAAPSQGQSAKLQNSVLEVSFDPATTTITVLDKRSNYRWRQSTDIVPGLSKVTVTGVEQGPGWIRAGLKGEELSALRLSLGPEEATLHVEVESEHGAGYYGQLPRFPYPFVIEEPGGYVVQCTTGDGVIFPIAEAGRMKEPFNLTGGMKWYGVTDLRKGCIAVLESFQHTHQTNRATAFPMKLRYHFTTEGGYVAQAKYYRRVAELQGKAVTLAKKMTYVPALAQMRGAPIIYLWGEARRPEMIRELKAAGIERGVTMWDLNHPPGPTSELLRTINEAGFLPGTYDIYLAIMNPATAWALGPPVYNTDRRHWPEGWPQALIDYRPGVVPPERKSFEAAYVCSSFLPEWSRQRITEELRHFDYKARFFDTLIPQVRSCDSPLHPMNMEQARDHRLEVLRFALEEARQITGSGEGYSPDWAVRYLCWMEGPLSLRYYISDYLNLPYRTAEGAEDWVDRQAPAAVTKDAKPDASFYEYEVNVARRLPLYALVYHDCVVTTWNWRGANHRIEGGWREKDLLCMLFGSPPVWQLTPETWRDKKDALVKSYHEVCGWLEKIAFDEMTDHRWLSPDRQVAMTSFSSGWNIAVNMSDRDFASERGVVKAKGWLTWKTP